MFLLKLKFDKPVTNLLRLILEEEKRQDQGYLKYNLTKNLSSQNSTTNKNPILGTLT